MSLKHTDEFYFSKSSESEVRRLRAEIADSKADLQMAERLRKRAAMVVAIIIVLCVAISVFYTIVGMNSIK